MLFDQLAKVRPLLPAEFWTLTPHEASSLVRGGAWREDREWERFAFLAAHVINMAGKKVNDPVSINDLLGRRKEVKVIDPGAETEALRTRIDEQLARLQELEEGE